MYERLIVPGHLPDLSEIETQVRRDHFTTVSSTCPGGHAEKPGGGQCDPPTSCACSRPTARPSSRLFFRKQRKAGRQKPDEAVIDRLQRRVVPVLNPRGGQEDHVEAAPGPSVRG